MPGKQSGQKHFGDMEATGRVPAGHFLKKIDGQINWHPSRRFWNLFIIPPRGAPTISP